MIVEINGKEHIADGFKIRSINTDKVIEVEELSHELQLLVYDEGTSSSDGQLMCVPLIP